MSVINTNYLSMVAQNNLQKSQSALGTAIERLSSGLRINSAKDDAAGQAIANRMNAQVQGLNQAARNANDGISAAQTTEGALNQINDNLNRIRVLTVQAENGTNNDDDLNSIQNEITERLTEINRISEETSFNGTQVLGIGGNLSIQVGANDNQRIEINMIKINTDELSLTGFNVNGSGATPNVTAGKNDILGAGFEQVGTTNQYNRETVTNNNALTGAGALDRAIAAGGDFSGGKSITVSLANTAGTTGFGSVNFNNAKVSALTYSATSDSFTYNIDGGALAAGVLGKADVAAELTEYASAGSTGTVNASITLGGINTDVVLKADGAITNTNNEALYLDEQGNITTTTTGTNAALTIDNLAAVLNSSTGDTAAAAVIAGQTYNATALNAFSTAKISIEGGPTFEAGGDAAAGGINVKGIEVSRARAAELFGQGNNNTITLGGGLTLAVDDGTGTGTTVAETTFTVNSTTGVLTGTVAAGPINVSRTGDLTEATTTTTTETLYVQEGEDNVTDATGKRVYMKQDNSDVTFDAETAGTRNENPLALLDQAIAKVDGFRSNLGAIQNRFESAIQNLTTTATNLAAAQSRVQDADYAVEVANMTRAQILQQAGTSVLAQANQIPQGVLSLLR